MQMPQGTLINGRINVDGIDQRPFSVERRCSIHRNNWYNGMARHVALIRTSTLQTNRIKIWTLKDDRFRSDVIALSIERIDSEINFLIIEFLVIELSTKNTSP
jgi:hypothetical protein